jgi:hypothetical protein
VLPHGQLARPPLLDRAAEAVAGAGGDVADPGRLDHRHAAGADQLVEDRVGDWPDQVQVAAALADQLMGEGERDGRLQRQPAGHARAVGHQPGHRLAHGQQLVSHRGA